MSKVAELAYDIEQLYIEGFHPTRIARTLGCPLSMVYDWLEEQNVAESPQEEEIYSPYNGA
jgi:DNA-directed RNA polymerase specialized sigma24 family protein